MSLELKQLFTQSPPYQNTLQSYQDRWEFLKKFIQLDIDIDFIDPRSLSNSSQWLLSEQLELTKLLSSEVQGFDPSSEIIIEKVVYLEKVYSIVGKTLNRWF
jgi:hypothetical protein